MYLNFEETNELILQVQSKNLYL